MHCAASVHVMHFLSYSAPVCIQNDDAAFEFQLRKRPADVLIFLFACSQRQILISLFHVCAGDLLLYATRHTESCLANHTFSLFAAAKREI